MKAANKKLKIKIRTFSVKYLYKSKQIEVVVHSASNKAWKYGQQADCAHCHDVGGHCRTDTFSEC